MLVVECLRKFSFEAEHVLAVFLFFWQNVLLDVLTKKIVQPSMMFYLKDHVFYCAFLVDWLLLVLCKYFQWLLLLSTILTSIGDFLA